MWLSSEDARMCDPSQMTFLIVFWKHLTCSICKRTCDDGRQTETNLNRGLFGAP